MIFNRLPSFGETFHLVQHNVYDVHVVAHQVAGITGHIEVVSPVQKEGNRGHGFQSFFRP